MTTGDIESHSQEIYGTDIQISTISCVTDKIIPIIKEWYVLIQFIIMLEAKEEL